MPRLPSDGFREGKAIVSRYDRWNAILELLAAGRPALRRGGGPGARRLHRDHPPRLRPARPAADAHAHAGRRGRPERQLRPAAALQDAPGTPTRSSASPTAAAELVAPGAVIGLNGGTTTSELARALATRATLDSGFTIVTNALNIAAELTVRRHVKIVVTGGVARQQSYELIGPLASGVLEQVTLDVAFLGVDAAGRGARRFGAPRGRGERQPSAHQPCRAGRGGGGLLEDREEGVLPHLPHRADRHPRHRRTASRPGRDPALRRRSDRGRA